MARKAYTKEFRLQAVGLCETTTPGATVRGIAEDLGITHGPLLQWLERYGTGAKPGLMGHQPSVL
jgi:putative transposase